MTYEMMLANEVERHAAEADEVTCEWCYGRGGRISPTIGYIPCVYCNGTGTVPIDTEALDEADEVTCWRCDGETYVVQWDSPRLLICPTCNGTGRIPADPSDGAADDAYERALDREATP